MNNTWPSGTRKQSAQSLDCSYNWRLENIIIFAAALDCSTWGLDTPHTVFSDYDAAEIQSTIQVTSEVSCRVVLTWTKSSWAQSWPCDGRWHDEKLHRLRPHLEDLASRHRNISWLHPSQSQYWIVFIIYLQNDENKPWIFLSQGLGILSVTWGWELQAGDWWAMWHGSVTESRQGAAGVWWPGPGSEEHTGPG